MRDQKIKPFMPPKEKKEEIPEDQIKAVKWLHFMLLVLLLVLVSFSIANILWPQLFWDYTDVLDYPLHSSMEAVGAIAAILVAFMPLQVLFGKYKSSYLFLSTGFLAMGLWDLFHSLYKIGHGFVFTHSIALLAGGFFFALFVFPWKINADKVKTRLLLVVGSITILLGILSLLNQDLFPEMVHNNVFTPTANRINFIAGLFFLISAVKITSIYIQEKNLGVLILLFTAVSSAIVGFTFQYSEAWSDSWWLWHIVRLIAFLAFLAYLFLRIQTINNERNEALQIIEEKQRQLIESEERYSVVNEATGHGLWDWNLITNEMYFSPVWKMQIGYQNNELENDFENWVKLLHPEDKERSLKAVNDYLKNPVAKFVIEFRFRHKEGHYIWIHDEAASVKDEKGNVTRMFGAHTDITAQKMAEEKIQKSEEKFQNLFNSVSIPLCHVKENGKIDAINDRFISHLGYTLDDIPSIDQWWGKAYPDKKYREWVMKNWGEAVQYSIEKGSDIKSDVYLVTCKNGEVRQIIIAGITFGKDVLATFIDVTEQRKAEEAIIREKEFSEAVINSLPGIFYLFNDQGKFIKWNKMLEELCGLTSKEIAEKSPFDYFADYHKEKIAGAIGYGFKEGEIKVEADFMMKGEIPTPFYFTGRTIELEGKPHLLGVGLDISQRKKIEKEKEEAQEQLKVLMENLQHSNKELERFAYVASHDLQEPLRMVASYTQLLERRYKGQLDERADKYIYYAVDGAKRMQNLINDLLDFSRISTRGDEFTQTDTNEVMKNALKNLQARIEETSAQIKTGELPVIKADSAQIERLFLNLIGNALKFCKPNEKPLIEINTKEQNDNWLFSIKDNGIGIDEKFKEKVFVIFQRLHGGNQYKGTGIGLAICKRIVQRHEGEIWFESEENKGATFYFTLKKYKLQVQK